MKVQRVIYKIGAGGRIGLDLRPGGSFMNRENAAVSYFQLTDFFFFHKNEQSRIYRANKYCARTAGKH